MNKEQFISELGECLRGEVSEAEYAESISYYRDFFREQESLGYLEEEICASLGSPRLIARSIIDAHGNEEETARYGGYGTGSYENDGDTGREVQDTRNGVNWKGVLHTVIGVLIVVAVLFAIAGLLQLLFPVILVFVVIMLILRFFQRK